MLPIYFAGAALVALFFSGCKEHSSDSTETASPQPNGEEVEKKSFSQAHHALETAMPGTQFSLSRLCGCFMDWSDTRNRYFPGGIARQSQEKAACHQEILDFQQRVIEEFKRGYLVKCGIEYYYSDDSNGNFEAAQGAICSITKQASDGFQ